MKAEDGGPAFPQIETTVHMEGHAGDYTPISDVHSIGGMTLRDYFAATVLPALVSEMYSWNGRLIDSDIPTVSARVAYEFANAMLVAREVK